MSRTPEHKRERFLVLASARQASVEDALRLIGNLASRAYTWEPKEVAALFRSIRAATDAAEAKFKPRRTTSDTGTTTVR